MLKCSYNYLFPVQYVSFQTKTSFSCASKLSDLQPPDRLCAFGYGWTQSRTKWDA